MFTDDVPDAAVLGSFWAVPDEGRLITMLAGWKDDKESEREGDALHADDRNPAGQQGEAGQDRAARQDGLHGMIHEVLVDNTDAADRRHCDR